MNVKEIIYLALIGINTSVKLLTKLREVEGISPEDKTLIDLKLRIVRDSVTPITDKDIGLVEDSEGKAMSLSDVDYVGELKTLFDTGKITEREYIANTGVYNAAHEGEERSEDISSLISSLDRTLARYKE